MNLCLHIKERVVSNLKDELKGFEVLMLYFVQ